MTSTSRALLVRHGEVDNARHVVYADLDGFPLSEHGRAQAEAVAARLANAPLGAVVSSPLERAVQTATAIAQRHGLGVDVDDDLTEWHLARRWAGVVWEELPVERPGELEAYLTHAHDLPFAPEKLDELAARVAAAVRRHTDGAAVVAFVSHQDPVQAGRLLLTGRSWAAFHSNKPGHASVVEIEIGEDAAAEELSYWEPDQGDRFPPPVE